MREDMDFEMNAEESELIQKLTDEKEKIRLLEEKERCEKLEKGKKKWK